MEETTYELLIKLEDSGRREKTPMTPIWKGPTQSDDAAKEVKRRYHRALTHGFAYTKNDLETYMKLRKKVAAER